MNNLDGSYKNSKLLPMIGCSFCIGSSQPPRLRIIQSPIELLLTGGSWYMLVQHITGVYLFQLVRSGNSSLTVDPRIISHSFSASTPTKVENLPRDCRSDDALRFYFGRLFGPQTMVQAVAVGSAVPSGITGTLETLAGENASVNDCEW